MTGIAFIMIACLFWALDTLFRYPLLGLGYSTVQIVWLEHAFLLVVSILWLSKTKQLRVLTDRRFWPAFIIIGGMGSAIATLAFTKAFSLINPTLVILLQKLQPVIAISLAAIWLKEPITKNFFRWSLVCLLGSFLLIMQDMQKLFEQGLTLQLITDSTILLGYALTLIAAISWGASTVFGKSLSQKGLSGYTIMSGRFVFGFIFITPWFYAGYQNLALATFAWPLISSVLIMVLLSGLLGMAFYYHGLQLIPSRVSALAEMFFPVAAILVNWTLLGAHLNLMQIVGAALLVIGSFYVYHAETAKKLAATQQAKIMP